MQLKVKRLTDTAKLPVKNHATDAGFDIFADEDITVRTQETIKTGIALEIPTGYYAEIVGRSGLTSKTSFRVNKGVIDSAYRGEIRIMAETYKTAYKIKQGDKIAQMILYKLPEFEIEEVSELSESERGTKGFGSSDKGVGK